MLAKVRKLVTFLQGNLTYSIFLMILALVSSGLLLYEIFFLVEGEAKQVLILRYDFIIACILFTDFTLGLSFNSKYTRVGYMRDNWLNLLSSLPISSDWARAMRILRVVRAYRVARTAVDIWTIGRRYRRSKRSWRQKFWHHFFLPYNTDIVVR